MTAWPDDLPRDPVDDWFARRFPFRHVLSAEIDADLRGRILLPVDVADKSFLGDVVEHAIGLSLCDEPPYRHLLNCLNRHRAATLLRMAGYQPDAVADLDAWHRGDTSPEPGRLFVAANRLAQILALLNPRWGGGPTNPDVIARIHLRRSSWRVSYWLAPQRRIVLLTVFRKTRGRETAEVERAVSA